MIRAVLVDDQELVRTGLRALAEHAGDITVVGEAATGADGLEVVRALRPDVVLMDVRMPGMDGIEATRHIVADADLAGTGVLVLTTFDEDELVFGAIRAGATGYLLKDVSPEELRTAVRAAASGEPVLAAGVTRTVMDAVVRGHVDGAALAQLTPRETDVLRLVGRGLNNREIADALGLSPDSARTYVSRLLARLGARDRARLVILAYETGLVRPGTST